MEENTNSTKKAKWLNTVVTLVLIVAISLSLFVAVQVLSKGYVTIAGHSVFRVVTGSMEPTIPVGSLLINKKVDIEEIKVDDIVCFKAKESAIMGKVITHRVVAVFEGSNGEIQLETKGDANLSIDAYTVNKDNFIGKVISYTGENNLMADIVSLFSDKLGFLGLIVFPCLVLAVIILRSSTKNIREELIEALEESEQAETVPVDSGLPFGMTQQEYEEMYARIRNELIEEIRQIESAGLHKEDEK